MSLQPSDLTTRELYIVLSDHCNFSCSHCLNSSGPKATKYRLSESDVATITNTVNQNTIISQVHFSGGEPSLNIPLIQSIQNRISRPVKYSMTTNAWFGENPDRFFDRVRLDEIVVSYDKFHAKHTDLLTVRNVIEEALRRKMKVILHCRPA